MPTAPPSPFRLRGCNHVWEAFLDGPNPRALVTASQAATYLGVSLSAVCNWAYRDGLVPGVKQLEQARDRHGKRATDRQGRRLYWLGDVLRAEAADRRPEAARRELARRRAAGNPEEEPWHPPARVKAMAR